MDNHARLAPHKVHQPLVRRLRPQGERHSSPRVAASQLPPQAKEKNSSKQERESGQERGLIVFCVYKGRSLVFHSCRIFAPQGLVKSWKERYMVIDETAECRVFDSAQRGKVIESYALRHLTVTEVLRKPQTANPHTHLTHSRDLPHAPLGR